MGVGLVRADQSPHLNGDVAAVQSDTVDVERERHCKETDWLHAAVSRVDVVQRLDGGRIVDMDMTASVAVVGGVVADGEDTVVNLFVGCARLDGRKFLAASEAQVQLHILDPGSTVVNQVRLVMQAEPVVAVVRSLHPMIVCMLLLHQSVKFQYEVVIEVHHTAQSWKENFVGFVCSQFLHPWTTMNLMDDEVLVGPEQDVASLFVLKLELVEVVSVVDHAC